MAATISSARREQVPARLSRLASLARAGGAVAPGRRPGRARGGALFGPHCRGPNRPRPARGVPGGADPAAAPRILAWTERATRLALSGETSALVTAPIAKAPL